MEKELLTTVGNVKVLIGQLKQTWLSPSMILEKDGKQVQVTVEPGEFELDFGELLVNVDRLKPQELKMLDDVLEVIADRVLDLKYVGWKKFNLKQEYLTELEIIDDSL